MEPLTVDSVLEQVRKKLNLSKETEWELLEEIRAHLEDSVEYAQSLGKDETTALLKAAEEFGLEESSRELQELHGEWEILQALMMCIVPIFCTLVMRWLLFSAEGTTTGWQTLFSRPTTLGIALVTLVLPLIQFRRWPYVTVGWACFWAISLVFMAFPAVRNW